MSDISLLLKDKVINSFMKSYVLGVCERGLDDAMCLEAISDAELATELGVMNEEDFKIFFYIDHFLSLESKEITGNLSAEQKLDLEKYMFNKRGELDYSNLVTYRTVILMWMKERGLVKSAYISSDNSRFVYKKYDLDQWKQLAQMVLRSVGVGATLEVALIGIDKYIKDIPERADFKAWYQFNFGKNRKLYNINKTLPAKGAAMSDSNILKVSSIFEEGVSYWSLDAKPRPHIVGEEHNQSHPNDFVKDQKALDMNQVKTKMVNRTFAIDKLLEKYRDILSHEQMELIEDSLNELRKKIRKLKMASIINDTLIKTAGILNKNNFREGGAVLLKMAADPVVPEVKAKGTAPESSIDQKNSPASKKERSIDELTKEDLKPILDKLYEVSVRLKRRNIVREIAGIDLDLYNLNVASFFPELTDAQAKLIEAFGYASNKIEDVIPKLRSVSMEPPLEYDVDADVAKEMAEAIPVEKAKKPAPKVEPAVEPKVPAAPTPPASPPQVK